MLNCKSLKRLFIFENKQLFINLINMAARRKHVKVEYEEGEAEGAGSSSDSKKLNYVPRNWEIVLKHIRYMRQNRDAPVDTMGCAKCVDKKASKQTQQFQILVALMLSSQTRDNITFQACEGLKLFGFNAKSLAEADVNELEEIIKPVGFYKTKARHIKQASQMLLDEFKGVVPNDLKSLLKLPGVGPKMANIALAECFNNVVGIGVDVHVHRIANRLKWTSKPTKTPDETQKELEAWMPRNLWREVNLLLVGFGQQICTPKSPHCSDCLNNTKDFCPSAFLETSPQKNKKN